MSEPASPARWLRAAALAGSSVALAAGGHLLAGGHVAPVFLVLLCVAGTVGAYHWANRERGLAAIAAAVLLVQVVAHLLLTVGHTHTSDDRMLVGHMLSAVALAAFLRFGEARLHTAVQRRYIRWLVALRLALATRPAPQPRRAFVRRTDVVVPTMWIPSVPAGRAPPAAACP